MSIWKIAEFNDEDIISSMQNNLVNNANSEVDPQTVAVAAIEELNKAADIFEELGQEKTAELFTKIILKLAEDSNDFKKVKIDTKGLTSKKMVENLKDHGSMFDKNKAEDGLSKKEIEELENAYGLNDEDSFLDV